LNPPEPPVFDEPWQAEAFALVVHLHERGAFTWGEWAQALGGQIEAAAARGEGDGARYYDQWLAALEGLATGRGMTDPAALAARKQAWAEAYRTTPHGKPVSLPMAEG
jgi:nitrile hydratase accessory protein